MGAKPVGLKRPGKFNLEEIAKLARTGARDIEQGPPRREAAAP